MMKTKVFLIGCLIACFLGISLVKGEDGDCSKQNNCQNCADFSNCGWCAPTQSCLNGTASGPLNSTCLGQNWEFNSCTPCNRFLDCRTCNVRDADCYWCKNANNGAGGCQEIGDNNFGCNYTKSCPCEVYGSCSECTGDLGCSWCSGDGVCTANNGTCKNGPVYNATTTCPCATNRDCPSCQSNGGCDWCASGQCDVQGSCTGPKVTTCMGYCYNVSSTCSGCVASKGCAWCGLTQQCVDTTTSLCPFSYSCPMCEAAGYCDICLNYTDCQWCDDTKSCKPTGTGCFASHTCSNYCDTYTSCTSCSMARGCGWCDDTQSCNDLSTSTCFLSHTCSAPNPPPVVPPKCGFNGGSFVGGMFFVIALVVLCVGGYLFYRWRTGRKFDYRELK